MTERRPSRLAALDGLRIVGALLVVTTHVTYSSGDSLTGPLAGVFSRMDAGVALFFVVSGFLLYRPHVQARLGTATPPVASRTRDWRTYALHRILRILPAAWIAVVAAAVLLPHPEIGLGHYLQIATMTQIYTPQPSVPGLTQLWSLSTEVAFYLLLPVFAVLLARLPGPRWHVRALVVLACTPALGLLWTAAMHLRLGGVAGLWLPAFIGWFGAGMALAVWRESRLAGLLPRSVLDDLVASPGTLWALAGALYLLLTSRAAGPFGLVPSTALEAATKNLGYALLGLLVVLPCVSAEPSGSRVVAVLGSPVARRLGDISYGVFAYHLIVLGLVERAIGHRPFTGHGPLLWIATVVLVLPVAWASYRYVERPIMQWGRRQEPAPPTDATVIPAGQPLPLGRP